MSLIVAFKILCVHTIPGFDSLHIANSRSWGSADLLQLQSVRPMTPVDICRLFHAFRIASAPLHVPRRSYRGRYTNAFLCLCALPIAQPLFPATPNLLHVAAGLEPGAWPVVRDHLSHRYTDYSHWTRHNRLHNLQPGPL